MKRLLVGLLISVFLVSLVFAASSAKVDTKVTITGEAIISDVDVDVNAGEMQQRGQNGSDYSVVELRSQNESGVNIRARLNIQESLDIEQGIMQNMQVRLSNGRNAQVKLVPETAAERAVERLRLKVCNESNNCTIELREVGEGNETRLNYRLEASKRAKLFGLIDTEMPVEADINAETGEFIRTRKPWWAFLATED